MTQLLNPKTDFIFNDYVCLNPNHRLVVPLFSIIDDDDPPIEAVSVNKLFANFFSNQNNEFDAVNTRFELLNYISSLDIYECSLFFVYTAFHNIDKCWKYGFYYNPNFQIQQNHNYLIGNCATESEATKKGFELFLAQYDNNNNEKPLPFVNFIKNKILGKQLVINFNA